MLEYTKEKLDDVGEVQFIYVDMHGNAWICMDMHGIRAQYRLSQRLIDCYHSLPVVMGITRSYMTMNAFTLLSYTLT